MSRRHGVVEVMDATRTICEALATKEPGAAETVLQYHDAARAAIAELIAADVEYNAARAAQARIQAAWKSAHDLLTVADADFLPLHAASGRVLAAEARRHAALVAAQGGAA